MCAYIYIYIYRERERERERDVAAMHSLTGSNHEQQARAAGAFHLSPMERSRDIAGVEREVAPLMSGTLYYKPIGHYLAIFSKLLI